MSGLDDFYFLFNKITQLSFRNVLFLKIDTVLILAKLPQNIYDDLIRESIFDITLLVTWRMEARL